MTATVASRFWEAVDAPWRHEWTSRLEQCLLVDACVSYATKLVLTNKKTRCETMRNDVRSFILFTGHDSRAMSTIGERGRNISG